MKSEHKRGGQALKHSLSIASMGAKGLQRDEGKDEGESENALNSQT